MKTPEGRGPRRIKRKKKEEEAQADEVMRALDALADAQQKARNDGFNAGSAVSAFLKGLMIEIGKEVGKHILK